MKVYYKIGNHFDILITVTYFIELMEGKFYSSSVFRSKQNKKRREPKNLLKTRDIKFMPSNNQTPYNLPSFQIKDWYIKFDIPSIYYGS